MLTSKANRLGDLKKFKVTADGEDITAAVMQTNIWQDIFSTTWSAELSLQDTNNMIHTIPLKQGTEIKIEIETKLPGKTDGKKEFEFQLYKITDRVLRKSRHQAYKLHCVTEEFLKNQTKRVQKWYNDTPDSIVQQVVSEEIGGSVETESATNKVNLITPNMSPFVIALWCAKFALNGSNADYVFFMKDKKKFVFKPVKKLYEDSSGLKLVQRIADMREEDGAIPDDRILAIKGFGFEHYDGLANLANGFFGSTTVWYDMVKKKWDKKDNNYQSESQTGKFKDDPLKANICFVPKHEKLFTDGENMYDTADEWDGSRRKSVMLTNQDRLFVQLPGGGKLWENIGKSCEVELPSHEDMSGEKFDKYYKGKYLIASIHHIVEDMIYSVNFELVKIKLEKSM